MCRLSILTADLERDAKARLMYQVMLLSAADDDQTYGTGVSDGIVPNLLAIRNLVTQSLQISDLVWLIGIYIVVALFRVWRDAVIDTNAHGGG